MANPRKFSEKIALHKQRQAEEQASYERVLMEVRSVTNPTTQQPQPTVSTQPPPSVNRSNTVTPPAKRPTRKRPGKVKTTLPIRDSIPEDTVSSHRPL